MKHLVWAAVASLAVHGGLLALPVGSTFKQPDIPMPTGIAVSLPPTRATKPTPPAAPAAPKDSVPLTPPAKPAVEAKAPALPSAQEKKVTPVKKKEPAKAPQKTFSPETISKVKPKKTTEKVQKQTTQQQSTVTGNTVTPPAKQTPPRSGSPKKTEATPRYEQNSPPQYPRLARKRGIEGTVLLDVLVSPSGRVDTVSLAQSSGYSLLDKSAVKAVRKWIFHPGKINGVNVEMNVRIPVRFDLTEVLQ